MFCYQNFCDTVIARKSSQMFGNPNIPDTAVARKSSRKFGNPNNYHHAHINVSKIQY